MFSPSLVGKGRVVMSVPSTPAVYMDGVLTHGSVTVNRSQKTLLNLLKEIIFRAGEASSVTSLIIMIILQ